MKKVLMAVLISLSFVSTIQALPEEPLPLQKSCSKETIIKGKGDLKNITYSLEYLPDATDSEGLPIEGSFKITILNIPEDYIAILKRDDKKKELYDNNSAIVNGDVYTLEIYNAYCWDIIKKMEINVPAYKKYCYINGTCEDEPWFDGTYEDKTNTSNDLANKKQYNYVLMTFLILVCTITVILIIMAKRRKKNEAAF